MSKVIAVAGKGGTGKTTITALLIRYIRDLKLGSILAIDADPSSNLNLALGLPLDGTVGDIREETLTQIRGGTFAAGMNKQDYLQYEIENALVESDGVDLLAMGRPEGAGCYCSANNMLRLCIDRLSKSYDFVVIDNEAGLEHLSRRTTADVDLLILVSDTSTRGLTTAGRVAELVKELKTQVGRMVLVVNRASSVGSGDTNSSTFDDLSPELKRLIALYGLDLIGTIPSDPLVGEYDAEGTPLAMLPPDSAIVMAIERIAKSFSDLLCKG